jgi:hypothetical protein
MNPDDYSVTWLLGGVLEPFLQDIGNAFLCAFGIVVLLWIWGLKRMRAETVHRRTELRGKLQ